MVIAKPCSAEHWINFLAYFLECYVQFFAPYVDETMQQLCSCVGMQILLAINTGESSRFVTCLTVAI